MEEGKAQISVKKKLPDTKLLLKKRKKMNRDKGNVEHSQLYKTICKNMQEYVEQYKEESYGCYREEC